MKGVALGLFDGEEEGETVQNNKLVAPSTYLYLIAFCELFVKFSTTGSQKKDEVEALLQIK